MRDLTAAPVQSSHVLPGYLLSLLVRQRALLKERFDARYPHAWLVWEPGARLRPQSPADLEAGQTQMPSKERGQYPAGNDALCFPLPEPSKPGNWAVSIGLGTR